MVILGIETSCDETASALIDISSQEEKLKINILANIVSSQVKLHAPYGGVVPNLASREHLKNIQPVMQECLTQSKIPKPFFKNIDLLAVTTGPGLMPSLLIGVNFAKALSFFNRKPIVGINHLTAHLYSFVLSSSYQKYLAFGYNLKNIFPAVALLVSGGHTQLFLMKDFYHFKLLGETRDDAAGECFDKCARILNLGYPGGPAISKAASRFRSKKKKVKTEIHLPRPMINSSDFDFSFSGLKTAVLYLAKDLKAKKKLPSLKDFMAFEVEEAITDVLVKKTLTAAKKYEVRSLILGGGVSANSRLKEKFSAEINRLCPELFFFVPEPFLATDNALMVAVAAFFELKKRKKPLNFKNYHWKKIEADANLRIKDEVR